MQFSFSAPSALKKLLDTQKPAHLSRSKFVLLLVQEALTVRNKKLK